MLQLLSLGLYGQQIQFEHIKTEDGLSQNSVVSIAQDSSGFLWFATQDGLNKYDGSNFRIYEVFFRDNTDVDNNKLGKVMVDKQGRVWMTTFDGGVQYCDPNTEKFSYVKDVGDASYILQADTEVIWVSSFSTGLYRISVNGEEELVDHLLKDISINKIISHDQYLYLTTQKGIIKYDPRSGQRTNLFAELKNITDLIITSGSKYYISTSGYGLYTANNEVRVEQYANLDTDLLIQDIHMDNAERLWVATYGNGLFMIKDSVVTHFEPNPLDDGSIGYNDILSLFEYQDSNLWFGSDGGGLSYITSNKKPIYSLTNSRMPDNIPVDVVRSLCTDAEDNIWIGTSGKGLTMISSDGSMVRYFNTNGAEGSKLTSDRVMSLLYDKNGDMWVGTQDGGLMCVRAGSEMTEQIDAGLSAKTIWDIKEAGEDHLWLCTRKEGLILFNKKSLTWNKLSPLQGFGALTEASIRVIIDGVGEEYLVGTDAGEVFAVRKDSRQRRIQLNRQNAGGIKCLYLDDDHLWIGTQQSGIIIINFNTGKQIEINKSSGLPNNVVYSILEQDERYVWISTNLGICQIDKDRAYQEEGSVVIQYLTAENGLIGNEFNTGAYHQSAGGTMYFGGIGGVNWFDPRQIEKDREPISIVLLDLITTNRDGQDIKHISDRSSIDLKHTDRNFQIRYVAQSYAKTKTKYQYKLEGINTEWIDNESNELVSFSNIPPGEYTLLLNATNSDGVWTADPVRFEINIIPAFWQTWWFKLLAICAVVGLIWFLFTVRVGEIRKTSALKEQITKVEAKALKLQMNPHFLFNSLNAIDNYILKNEKLIASDYLSKFSKLMRQILDYSEHNRITLTQELETLGLYIKMEQLRFLNKFNYEINIDNGVDTNAAMLPPLILQPFVENAIWHGLMHMEGDGMLNITICNINNGIKCVIEDNGIGRESAKMIKTKSATKYKSHGIRITKERLNLNNELNKIGANIYIEDKYDDKGEPQGTKVTIHLPSK